MSINAPALRVLSGVFVLLFSACADPNVSAGGEASIGATIAPSEFPQGSDSASRTESLTPPQAAACLSDGDCASGEVPICHRAVCTNESCVVIVADDQAPCEDGNACTLDTFCSEGNCGGGRATTCSDDNPCTVDTCDPLTGCAHTPAPSGGPCNDNDPCSLGDTCLEGLCTGELDPVCVCEADDDCTIHEDDSLCNGSLRCVEGACRLDPTTVVTCPPSGGCLVTACQPSSGACVTQDAPNGTGCDDGNPCTIDDRCSEGTCEGSAGACPCAVDDDCAVLQTESYDLCQGPLRCGESGLCSPDTTHAVTCPTDEDPADCVEVACNPGTGNCATTHRQNGAECEGADPCSPLGACQAGLCIVPAPSCDDSDPCTNDTCAGDAGCLHTPRTGGPCSDGDACTGDDQCDDGLCMGGPAVVCDDGNPCTLDKCVSAAGGCTAEALSDGLTCQPNDLCVGPGDCQAGDCVGGSAISCGNPEPCKTLHCVPDSGCVEELLTDGTACEDGNPCTQAGMCQQGTCTTIPMACNDGNPCTMDSCDSGECVYTTLLDGSGCDTGNACEQYATCNAGVCQGAVPVTCEPGLCDVKGCDPATGACVVTHVSVNDMSCGGTNGCQVPGQCQNGVCDGMSEVSCDDGDECTMDLCQPEFGLCKHTATLCPPDALSPCSVAGCDLSTGCTLTEDTACHAETLLWFDDFACSDAEMWSWGEELGHPLFQSTSSAPSVGALAEGCQANITIPSSAVASDTPWTSSMISEAFVLPDNYEGALTIRFWHAWEWEGAGMNEDIERRLQLLDSDKQVIASQPLSYSDAVWGSWVQEEISFNVASAATHRIALTLTSKPTDAAFGCTWTVDHVVIFAPSTIPP